MWPWGLALAGTKTVIAMILARTHNQPCPPQPASIPPTSRIPLSRTFSTSSKAYVNELLSYPPSRLTGRAQVRGKKVLFLDKTLSGPIDLFAKFSLLQVEKLSIGWDCRSDSYRTLASTSFSGSMNPSRSILRRTSSILRAVPSRMPIQLPVSKHPPPLSISWDESKRHRPHISLLDAASQSPYISAQRSMLAPRRQTLSLAGGVFRPQANIPPDQIKNNAKIPGHDFEYSVFLVPRRTLVCEKIFEDEGILGEIAIREFPLYFLPLEPDVLSLELESSFEELYLVRGLCPLRSLYSLCLTARVPKA